jgi:hypothetical protein
MTLILRSVLLLNVNKVSTLVAVVSVIDDKPTSVTSSIEEPITVVDISVDSAFRSSVSTIIVGSGAFFMIGIVNTCVEVMWTGSSHASHTD